jgi:hypothetical protein
MEEAAVGNEATEVSAQAHEAGGSRPTFQRLGRILNKISANHAEISKPKLLYEFFPNKK